MSELERAAPLTKVSRRKTYLFWGPGGSGKTTLAAKHPGKRKLWLDIDDKLGEMENFTDEERSKITVWTPGVAIGADTIQVVQVDPKRANVYTGTMIASEPKGYKKIVDITNELLQSAADEKFEWDCVILDTLTRTMDHLEYLTMYAHKTSLMQETLYGVTKRNIKEYLTNLFRLPCDVIVCAHEKHVEKRDKTTNTVIESFTRPLVVGTIATELVNMVTEAYYFQGSRSNGKWYIQTQTDRTITARTAKKLDREQEILPERIFG